MDTPVLDHARSLALPRIDAVPDAGFYLAEGGKRLALCRAGEPPERAISTDFDSADIRRRSATGRRLELARALGLQRNPGIRVLDTTCGLGRDSAVLAALGCQVTALERHPGLHALLADGLRRSRLDPPIWRGAWQAVHHADAREWLLQQVQSNNPTSPFDAIYIDPMFTSPRRKARPQRALQWLNELLGPDDDVAALLSVARSHARQRVVVKSHARAAPLAPPDHQVAGKAMRFDVYFNASNDF